MKKILMATLLAGFVLTAGAQSQSAADKLAAAYSDAELLAMDPEQLSWLTFLADNQCIVSYNPEKAAGLPEISMAPIRANVEVPALAAPEQFNPLFYAFVGTASEYYRIGDTGYTVFVYSQERLAVLYQRYLANTKEN